MSDLDRNRFLSELAYNRGDVVLENLPEVFGIESTNYCNIKCIMCPRGEPDLMRRPLGHMNNDLLASIVDQAAFFTAPSWLHWFGEPLMNPFLFEQIEIAKRKVPNLGISTNATLLRDAAQMNILKSGLDTIIIAIDGASKEVYEKVRKSERFTFGEVTGNAERFLSLRKGMGLLKPRVILSIIAMDMTSPLLEEFRAHWLDRGADEVLFKPFVNWGGQNSEVFDGLETVNRRASLSSPRSHPCKLMWQSLLVAWDGRVVPCCYDYDAKIVLGDLKTQSLSEIWNGEAYVELRRAELAGVNQNELCLNCSQAPGHAPNTNLATFASLDASGLHSPETWEGRPARWTNGRARVVVPAAGDNRQLTAKFWSLPGRQAPVTITANGVVVFDGLLADNGLETTVAIPDSTDETVIVIQSPSFQVPGDSRSLGVAIENLQIN